MVEDSRGLLKPVIFRFHADFAARAVGVFLDFQSHVVDLVVEDEFGSAKTAVILVLDDELVFVDLRFELKLLAGSVHGVPHKLECVQNNRIFPVPLEG